MIVKDIKLNPELSNGNNIIRVELRYSLGGLSYADYKVHKRGYYIHLQPMKYSCVNGIATENYSPFDGYKALVKEVNRQSAKSEKEALELAQEYITRISEKLVSEGKVVLANG